MRLPVLRASALALGLVAALVLAEIMLRVLDLVPSAGVGTVNAKDFARLPGIWGPNQRVDERSKPTLSYRVTINSLGFRGGDFSKAKPEGEVRVLLVGDSFTFGDFVDDDETLPAQVQRALSASCSAVRVINAGLSSATIIEESKLAERALAVSPDLVLLVFFENDVTDLLAVPSVWDQLAINRRAKSRFPLSIAYPLARNTSLWNLGLRVLQMRRMARAAEKARPMTRATPAGLDTLRARLRTTYLDNLSRLRDTLAARSVPLSLVVYPSHISLRSDRAEQVEWISTAAQSMGLRVINLLIPLATSGLPDTTLYLLPTDEHPSPRGHSLAGAYVARELVLEPQFALRCKGARLQ
jgi:hypothetical protein